jgi:hypothetical protein
MTKDERLMNREKIMEKGSGEENVSSILFAKFQKKNK